MAFAKRYFPQRHFPPRYFPPGRPGLGAHVIGLPPARAPSDEVAVTDLQLIEPVRMVPILVITEATPQPRQHFSPLISLSTGYNTKEHTITNPLPSSTEVLLKFKARARLAGPNDYFTIELLVNLEVGVERLLVGYVFGDTGHDCPSSPTWDYDELRVTAEDWNGLLAQSVDGVMRLRMRSSYLTYCYASCIQSKVFYTTLPPAVEEPPYLIWRSEAPVILGDGTVDYLYGEFQYDPVTNTFVVVTPSKTLNKVALSGLRVAFDAQGAAYLCSPTVLEKRGCVVRFSSQGWCPPE